MILLPRRTGDDPLLAASLCVTHCAAGTMIIERGTPVVAGDSEGTGSRKTESGDRRKEEENAREGKEGRRIGGRGEERERRRVPEEEGDTRMTRVRAGHVLRQREGRRKNYG